MSSESASGAMPDGTDAAIGHLVAAVRLRDPGLADHGQRAGHIAAAIAMELGLSTSETDRAYLGGHLHDIGKLGVTEATLWKPAGLTRSEWDEIRTHPEKGHRLVVNLVHRDVAAAVLSHHERLDAGGYPFGIDARTLPLTVRIVQVADAYDAMTSDRPYQPALSSHAALTEIGRCAGTQFDPDVAKALESILALDEPEEVVDLTSSAPAVVLPADPFAATA